MITGIILASGFSNRMGKDKLLIEMEGQKIIERVIKACILSRLDKVILVYRKKEIKEIAKKYKISTQYNGKAYKGQSESMKIGVKNTHDDSSYMFLLADQPFINAETINKLIKEYKESKATIAIPYYAGERGMPIIVSNRYKEELLSVIGDQGGREIIKKYFQSVHVVNIEDRKIGKDIDRPQDLIH